MELRDIDNRLAEIRALDLGAMDDQAEVEKLTAEVSELNEQRAALIEQRKAEEAAVIASTTEPIETHENREAKPIMENTITRNSPEYINAYAEAIKSGDDTELRSLLTENVQSGTVAVPDVVANIVKEAWESNEVFNRIPKSYLRGNYKIQFEISGEVAVKHTEGGDPIQEEDLDIGIATLQPAYFKKYVKVSDEAMSLTGEAFLQYIYSEIAHKIIEAILKDLFAQIDNAPASATATTPSASHITVTTPAITDFIGAVGDLEGDLRDVVIVTSRSVYAGYKSLAASAPSGFDPFDGMEVLFSNQLPQNCLAIVGSFRDGAHVNMPNGPEIEYKIDDTSLALTSEDMVAILGRLYAGVGIVRCGAFVTLNNQ